MMNTLQNQNNKTLVKKYDAMVTGIAYNFSKKTGMPVDDLKQVGYIGMLKACKGYNQNLSSLKTYINKKVCSEIMHYLRDSSTLLKVNSENLKNDMATRLVSLDIQCDDESNTSLIDTIVDNNNNDISIKLDMDNALNLLHGDVKKVIFLKYYYGMKQSEIARKMDMNEMRVSRLHDKGISILREFFK